MARQKKTPVKLKDLGITYQGNKTILEKGIKFGYQPQFGFPLMDFSDVKTAFDAIVFEDETGHQEPYLAELNSGEFQKLANLLI